MIEIEQMEETKYKLKGPWVVLDPVFKREWVLPQPLRYYVVEDRQHGTWFVCDRWTDLPVPSTETSTRPEAIRRFYEFCNRQMPEGTRITRALAGTAHHGEQG